MWIFFGVCTLGAFCPRPINLAILLVLSLLSKQQKEGYYRSANDVWAGVSIHDGWVGFSLVNVTLSSVSLSVFYSQKR